MGQTCKVCRAWEAYADVGKHSTPIRLGYPEGKREVLLARDVHDRVTQREEGGICYTPSSPTECADQRPARHIGAPLAPLYNPRTRCVLSPALRSLTRVTPYRALFPPLPTNHSGMWPAYSHRAHVCPRCAPALPLSSWRRIQTLPSKRCGVVSCQDAAQSSSWCKGCGGGAAASRESPRPGVAS